MELRTLRARVAELERAKAELEQRLEARKESEERLEGAVRGASDGLWNWDLATGDLWWSPRFRELVGYAAEELPASYASFRTLLHRDDRDRLLQAHRLHLQEDRPYEIEYRLRTKKDGYRWFLSRGAVVRDGAGRPVRTAGSIQDIDERKRVEASHARLVSILEATTDFVGIIDRSHKTVYINRAGRRMVGLGEDEDLQDTAIVDRHPAWALKIVLEEGIPAAARDGYWVGETALSSADGREIPVSQLILAHKDKDGGVEYLSTVARDISARKEAEAALRESNEKLLMAQRVAKLGFVVWSLDTNEMHWSEQISHLLGIDGGEQKADFGATLGIVPADEREFVRNNLMMAAAGTKDYDVDHRMRRLDGEVVWVHAQGELIRDADGNPERLFGTVLDITERKRIEEEHRALEAQLRQAQKMEAVGQLAAGVAHDFNNILTVILGNTELLLPMLKPGFDEGAKQAIGNGLEEIKAAGERAAALTRQLMAFGRRETITAEVIDLDRAIRDAEEMLRRLLREDIGFDVYVAPGTHCIRADAGHIEQVVMNLVLNASDAMPGGGTLRVTCVNADLDEAHASAHVGARSGPHVMVAVSDTGVGMDKEMAEHIFEPFFTTKPMGKGTGLGLATVYGILRQTGGHISVESKPERGSTFRVYLPAALEERAEPETAASTDGSGGDEVILVCEDEERVRQLICRVLRTVGYTVLEAEDGRAALAVAASYDGPIHLLVSDVVMPEMDGKQLFHEMAKSRPETRVVFVSGYTADVIDGEIFWSGTRGFLQKPFSPSALRARVREMLDQA